MVTPRLAQCCIGLGLLVSALLAPVSSASAQNYPARRITLVVPYTPGSGFDIVARTVGQKLAERWGQPVIVDNKAGASGTIGTEAVANAAPDGYTLLVSGGPHTVYPSLDFDLWFGFLGPANLPAAIVRKWDDELAAINALADVKESLLKQGLAPMSLDSAATSELIRRDIARWREVVQNAGVKPE